MDKSLPDNILEIPNGLRSDLNDTLDHVADAFVQQSQALDKLSKIFSRDTYRAALRMIMQTKGHVIIIGMGKSGHVGRKVSATMASTGTPSFFLHPAEASHGDLGMITPKDTLMLISYSGETQEIIQLVPHLKKFGNKVLAITGKPNSSLASISDVVIDIHVDEEACPQNLVPTTSITVTSAIGDALALALMQLRNFGATEFARFHPGGSLGKKLLNTVSDLMAVKSVPIVSPSIVLLELASEMAGGAHGVAVVVNEESKPIGVVTKDQLAVALRVTRRIEEVTAHQVMSSHFETVTSSEIVYKADEDMRHKDVKFLLVVDDDNSYKGLYKPEE
ncbi:KpsF/GutQ family sugar-phosphate isomerase [Temperatibacter marinus]|uniref:KpsF/GutQ family sugar-phosphate isomerase n=1 Tax=Temperatibacter marinus TaxID=1456591 RepID=A0AA52H9U8_9PROT|nr:KpsF/GutQ family sugar-phosphate isomerase [Temperatibacter marinus]WND02917.1 KpsF/GutQ family sugar-phosphate isomerase [Temperatibacter marinus]